MSTMPGAGKDYPPEDLLNWTKRQEEVLALIAAGKSNGEIATALGVTLDGAKHHVREVMSKLDVGNREDAAEYWRWRQGLPRRLGRAWRHIAAMLPGGGSTGVGAAAGAAAVSFGIGVALLGPWSSDEPGDRVARQVFVEHVADDRRDRAVIGEGWALVDADDRVQAFVGRYYDADGALRQAQYRGPDEEPVYRGAGGCVEVAPPAPAGLEGLLPATATDAELRALGYERADQATPPAAPSPGVPNAYVAEEERAVEVDPGRVWQQTVGGEGAERQRTLALDRDGTVAGFWSRTIDEDGIETMRNSRVVTRVGTYPAEVFDEVLSEAGFNDLEEC